MRILTCRRLQFDDLFFSPDGQYLAGRGWATSPSQLFAPVWATNGDAKPLVVLTGEDPVRRLYALAFTPDGRLLTATGDGWFSRELAGGEPEEDVTLTTFRPDEVSKNGRWAVHSEVDGDSGVLRLRVIGNDRGRWVDAWSRELRYAAFNEAGEPVTDSWEGFSSLRLAASGTRLLLCFARDRADGSGLAAAVRVLDTVTGADVFAWRGQLSYSALQGEISPTGHLVFLRDRSFQVIDPSKPDSEPLTRTSKSRKHFTDAAFSPDGQLLATTSNDTTVTMWDTATWEPIRQYAWDIGRLRAVAFAPDGLTCAAGSDTGKVVVWDVDV